jgi:cell division protein FtsW (lipid II flippase)
MSFEEKGVWTFGVVTLLAYLGYVVVVLAEARAVPLVEVDYVWPMVISIGVAVVAYVIGIIVISAASPADAGRKDERDRQIYQRGEYIGQSMVVIGGMVALVMAWFELDYFWIANALYLFFVLAALLASAAKLAAYRSGFDGW